MSEKSRLQRLLEQGQFTVTAEITPPMGGDGQLVLEKARTMRGYVDAVNITDNPSAVMRMSSIASATFAAQAGVEPIIQMTCRDRNRIAMQSDLLGAWAMGLRNLLCLSGDHQSFGNDPQAKNVYDLDSIQLLQTMNRLKQESRFLSGKETKAPPKFFLGATASPFADPPELQMIRLQKKIAAGAQFIQTQTIYDVDRFAEWMKGVRKLGLHEQAHILVGVMVNKSVRSMEMTNRVPGIDVPEKLLERMRQAEYAQAEGLKVALELIGQLKQVEGVSGVHVIAVGWQTVLPVLIGGVELLPRPQVKEENDDEM